MGSLLNGPKLPTPPPETPMPDENDPAVVAAKKRAQELAQSRSGRTATILSDSYDRDTTGAR